MSLILLMSEISVIQTAKETGDRLTPKASIPFVPHVNNSLPQIILDPSTKYQQILGFGAAFTDSVAAVFSGRTQELFFFPQACLPHFKNKSLIPTLDRTGFSTIFAASRLALVIFQLALIRTRKLQVEDK